MDVGDVMVGLPMQLASVTAITSRVILRVANFRADMLGLRKMTLIVKGLLPVVVKCPWRRLSEYQPGFPISTLIEPNSNIFILETDDIPLPSDCQKELSYSVD